MRSLAAMTLVLVVLLGVGLATARQADAATLPTPVPVVPPAAGATLVQQPAGTWTTDVYLDTAALCGNTYDLVTGAPASDEPAATVTYDGSSAAPCGAGQAGHGPVTKVEAAFPALPHGAVPLTGTLVVTPSAAALAAGATPVEVALTVRRDVSAVQYLWIPLWCGLGLAVALIVLTMLIGVPRPDGKTAHAHRDRFWRMPLYASSAWTWGDSWVTNITAVGTLIGTLLTASSSITSLLPGVETARFALLLVMAGGFAVIAPVIFGLLNYRFGRTNPQAAGIVAIRAPERSGGVTLRMHVGGSVAVPGGATLDGGAALSPGTTLNVPVGTVAAVSAGRAAGRAADGAATDGAGADAGEILVLRSSNEIVLPPALRLTLSPAVIVPSSAIQAPQPAEASRGGRGARGGRPAESGWASRVMALVRPDDRKTAPAAVPAPVPATVPARATVASLTAWEGATISFVGRADLTLPAGSLVGAVGETALPARAPASAASPGEPPPEPHTVALPVSRTFGLPSSGEVISQMWSMLLASCFTMFGIGANLGIVGWVVGYDLAAAPSWAHGLVAALSGLAAVIIALYGVFAIRALADSREGSVLSNRRGASFML